MVQVTRRAATGCRDEIEAPCGGCGYGARHAQLSSLPLADWQAQEQGECAQSHVSAAPHAAGRGVHV